MWLNRYYNIRGYCRTSWRRFFLECFWFTFIHRGRTMTTAWKYTDAGKLVVFRTCDSGVVESILARLLSAAELATVLPPEPPPPPTQDELDTVAARQYQKAQAS